MPAQIVRIILQGLSFGTASAIVILFLMHVMLKMHVPTTALTPNMSSTVLWHLCKTPDPKINVTEAQFLTFWQLPPVAKLSSRMESIGRCRIAAESKNRTDLQPDVCDCVSASWPLFVWLVAILDLHIGLSTALTTCVLTKQWRCFNVADDVRSERFKVLFWMAMWAIVMSTCVFQRSGTGLTYEMYGDTFDYYRTPQSWSVAWSLAVVVLVLKIVHFSACTVALLDATVDLEQMKVAASRLATLKLEMQLAALTKLRTNRPDRQCDRNLERRRQAVSTSVGKRKR